MRPTPSWSACTDAPEIVRRRRGSRRRGARGIVGESDVEALPARTNSSSPVEIHVIGAWRGSSAGGAAYARLTGRLGAWTMPPSFEREGR